MARKRMLSPEMFRSSTVCSWRNPATRWTWAGLLCYLDDYGYGEDDAMLVKAEVWPRDEFYTVRKIAADLDRITESGALCRFSCCGKPQFHSPSWGEWQSISHPAKFRFCPCPGHDAPASRIHRRLSGESPETFYPSVVQENLDQRSSRDGEPSGPTPEGSDGLAAAKAAFGKLGRASA